ncbi:MAG TPA: hypothetical protein VI911_00360 [Patescibacteria group bacterium]|nr:hypothetical protein [Patescibacteria group bacterium]
MGGGGGGGKAPAVKPAVAPVEVETATTQAAVDNERRRLVHRYNRESTFLTPITQATQGKTMLGQ